MKAQLFFALFALASCQQPSGNVANEAAEQKQLDAPVTDVDAIPVDETAAAAVGENDDAPPVQQTSSSALPTHIPERFWGRWGLVPADCTSTRGDNKGLVRIDDNRLYFYESKATLARIIAATPTRFEAEYGFGGEGQEWTEEQVLELSGNKMRRIGGGEQPLDLTYTRCP
jgi:hypothetical protein